MSISITIQGQVISFPASSESPNWAQGIISFAQAVESALNGLTGQFDVPPTIQNIDAQNPTSSPVDLTSLSFPTASVRGAFIRLTVFRNTNSVTTSEIVNLLVTYNPNGGSGTKWAISRDSLGDSKITFNITDGGQVQFQTTAISGSGHTGTITYLAQALLQS